MTRDEIIRMAWEAGFQVLLPRDHVDGTGGVYVEDDDIAEMLERFAALVAAAEREACAAILKDQMIRDGWRQCAKGQSTTQFCALAEDAVLAERDECARVCDEIGATLGDALASYAAAAIRART